MLLFLTFDGYRFGFSLFCTIEKVYDMHPQNWAMKTKTQTLDETDR